MVIAKRHGCRNGAQRGPASRSPLASRLLARTRLVAGLGCKIMKSRYALSSLCVASAICSVATAAAFWFSTLAVVVRNTGNTPLRDVVVHVTGNSYSLGDLDAGSQKRVLIEPTGDSHVELSVREVSGHTRRLTGDCYFEPGYHGTIRIDVSDGRINCRHHGYR